MTKNFLITGFLALSLNASAQNCFSLVNDSRYYSGDGTQTVTIADFNQDGVMDVASGNYMESSLSIFIGEGDGTFSLHEVLSLSGSPQELESGDFNGDGFPDLICAMNGGPEAGIFLNENGSFPNAEYVSVSTDNWLYHSVALGDLNGDGYVDMVLTDSANDRLHISIGVGNGVFLYNSVLSTLDQPVKVNIAQVNGSGALDVVCSYQSDTHVTVFTQSAQGDAVFNSPQHLDAGALAVTDFCIADFNGDNLSDIAIAGQATAHILLGAAGNTFSQGNNVSMAGYGYEILPVFANSDNIVDLAWVTDNAGTLNTVLGNGNGTFQSVVSSSTHGNGQDIAFGDLDNDGNIDAVSANYNTDNINIMLGNTDGSFGSRLFTTNGRPRGLAVADFDEDGFQDIVVATWFPSKYALMFGTGEGMVAATLDEAGPNSEDVATGDLNLDGNMDFVLVRASQAEVFLGNGNGMFQPAQTYPAGSAAGGERHMVLADLNGDGMLDLAGCSVNDTELFVLLNNGSGGFQAWSPISCPAYGSDIAAGDIDGDGAIDLVVSFDQSNAVYVFENNGVGSFVSSPVVLSTAASPRGVTLANFDGASGLDIAVACNNSESFQVFLHTSAFAFSSPISIALPIGTSPGGMAQGDLNGDGFQDVLVSSMSQNKILYFTGNGDGSFGAGQSFSADVQPGESVVTDFNNDGALDIVVSNYVTKNVSVILNSSAFITIDGSSFICNGQSRVLTASGEGTFLWNTGETTESISVSEAGQYYCTITNTAGTCSVVTPSISVVLSDGSVVTFLQQAIDDPCLNESPFPLSGGSPQGGVYSGPGVQNGVFNPQLAGVGVHELMYSYTDPGGCGTNMALATIEVLSSPSALFTPPTNPLCIEDGDWIVEGGEPAGGVYSGDNIENGIFNPVAFGEGIVIVTYTVSSENGCSASSAGSVWVDMCTSVEEAEEQSFSLTMISKSAVIIKDANGLLRLFDSTGKLVWSKNVNGTVEADWSELSNGVYIFSCSAGFQKLMLMD